MTTSVLTRATMNSTGAGQLDAAGMHSPYDLRFPSYPSSARPPSREHGRPELPRPLEPRPTYQLQSSLSDTSTIHSRQGSMNAPSSTLRTQGQNLPTLRDLFSPRPQETGGEAYNPSHGPSQPSAAIHQRQDGFPRPTLHPPLALHPARENRQQYQSALESRALPTPQAHAAPRYAPHHPPSQYQPHPDAAREYAGSSYAASRPESSASYQMHDDTSSYSTGGAESRPYAYSHSGLDPPTPGSAYPAVAENQGKYLGVREISGEGMFHLYEGGLRIPTHVDGEQVNPAWGLTKANKPRKRLAIACLDCREKKIKCEPGINSCLQCEKAKRPCRRPQTQPSQTESTPSATWSSASSPPRVHGASDPTPQTTQVKDFEGAAKRRQRADTSPTAAATKKHRSASPSFGSPRAQRADPTDIRVHTQTQEAVRTGYWQQSGLGTDVDPFSVDPETTLYLLDLYFAHVNSALYCMFPQQQFLSWVKTALHKGQNELMVLYSVLATGSIFAADAYKSFGRQCTLIVTEAIVSKHGTLHTLLAQARLLMCICSFAQGDNIAAWEYPGGAIRTACGMKLHTEEGCLDGLQENSRPHWEFHFSKEQMAECRRRTFWSLYLVDRFAVLLDCGTQTFIHGDDIFVRLPCADEAFERGLPSEAPYYNNGITDPTLTILTAASPVAPMAWLALGGVMWGDVMTFLNRSRHRPQHTYGQAYDDFYGEVENAIQGWLSRMPEHLQYRESNLERAVQHGYASCFIAIHTVHHYTMMKLNRWARHSLIPQLVSRNIRVAHHHAQQHLQMMRDVYTVRKEVMPHEGGTPFTFSLSTTFTGHATLSAIDIVAAGGLDQQLRSTLEAIEVGIDSLSELARYWNSGNVQYRAAHMRRLQLQNVIQRPQVSKGGCWLGRHWGIVTPIEQKLGLEDDCIYGVDAGVYFAALDHDAQQTQRTPSGAMKIA